MTDVERRDIWVEDWNKANVDAVKASDYDALAANCAVLRQALQGAVRAMHAQGTNARWAAEYMEAERALRVTKVKP